MLEFGPVLEFAEGAGGCPTALVGQVVRRFETVASVVAGLLLVVTLAIVWRGDRATYEPVLVEPTPGAVEVSTRAPILVHFGRDLDGRTLAGRLRTEPPTTGALTGSGPTLRWQPEPSLATETEYTVVLEPGLRSTSGRASTDERRFTFRTRAPQLLLARHETDGVRLILATLDGREREAARLEPVARDLALSPEGDRLAYVAAERPEPGHDRLWVVDLTTGDRHSIAEPEPVALAHPDWSPDGRRLAYERRAVRDEVIERFDLSAPPRQIWQADADGRPLGAVYGGDGRVGYMPIWSPIGDRLAFFEPNYKAIALADFGPRVATIPWGGGTLVDWSRDGQRLLVTESEATPADPARSVVRILDADGGPGRALTPPEVSDRAPAWSPDGARIALVRAGPGGSGVWLADPAGGAARPILVGGAWAYLRPAWSADGRWLAFNRLPAGPSTTEIWVAPRDGEPCPLTVGELVAWVP